MFLYVYLNKKNIKKQLPIFAFYVMIAVMREQTLLQQIELPLLEWYRANKRKLPWRDKNNAYMTWVSEIMLQQTRVEAVKPYFQRFLQELPDVAQLAVCPEEKLLKLWEGLGYYNRVRNMQKAAREVMEQYEGILPADYEKLKGLTGIGNYTAGAIASIAYGIPVPAVDGNVLRVISRVTKSYEDIMKQSVRKKMEQQLLEVMPQDCPGDYNQALMELGAVVCVPNGMAKCEACPLREICLARRDNCVMELPVKAAKKPRKIEERTVLVIQDGERVAIRKRVGKGLLAGLYELPNLEGHMTEQEVLEYVKEQQLDAVRIEPLTAARHIFSHVEWRMIGYRVRVAALEKPFAKDMIFADKKETKQQYAIPSAFDAYSGAIKEEKFETKK